MKSQNSNVGKPASSSSEGCPSRHQLIGLLDETNAPDETVAEHVSLCTDCQTILDQLTDHDQLSDYKRQASKPRFSNFLDPAIRAGDLGRIGDLHVESQIGIGGMGVVFRGRDDSLNRTVAIKVLKPLSSAKAVQRFERESKAVGRISHDHVVPVYSTGRASDGSPYLVMPLIEGKTLKQRIVDGPIPVLDSVDIIRQVAEGLEAAHQEELIHRDVKPANILLDQRDNRAKLADFGLVRTADDSTLTQVDVICGTPEYISPEQITDAESTDARCDIYSLGITLYQCLTGSPPFRGLPLEILDQHRTEEPIPPSRLNREVPQDVETICLKAISKPRGKRYDTAAEFAADLSRWQNKEPILARPPSTIQRLGFLVRKNKALFLSLASILLVLAIATAVSVWFALVANRATNQAEKNLEVAKKRLGVVVDSIRLSNPELGADPSMSAKDLLVARLVTGQLEQAHDELEPLLELTKNRMKQAPRG